MKILWISHNVPYPPIGGVLQRNYNLLKEVSRTADINLVAFLQKAILPIKYDLDEARRELGKICRQVDVLSLPSDSSRMAWRWLVFRSMFTSHPYATNWLKSSEMHRRLRQLANTVSVDLVHFDTVGLAEYRDAVGDTPRALNHHNIESQLMERRSSIERDIPKRMYFKMEAAKLRRYEEQHCRQFDVSLTVSDADKMTLRNVVPGIPIEVVPNGVDTDYFSPQNGAAAGRNLIFVAGMNWYPNRDAAIYLATAIWPQLKKKMRDLTLTVVGAEPPRELLDLARRDSSVEVTGFVDDVRPYMRRAQAVICPMRDGGGTRLKVLDALAMGKPMVSTTLGCEGIDLQPGKNVLIADTPSEFVAQVARLMEDAALKERLGREGRRLVEEKYSWKVIGAGLRDFYGRLATSRA